MKKIFFIILFILLFTKDIYAGQWVEDNGKWKYKINGEFLLDRKYTTSDGNVYYFDKDGYMFSGFKKIGDYWYYFGKDGKLDKDKVVEIKGKKYVAKDGKLEIPVNDDFTEEKYNEMLDMEKNDKKIEKNLKEEEKNIEILHNNRFIDYVLNVDVVMDAEFKLTKIANGQLITNEWVQLKYENGAIGKYYYDENGERKVGPHEVDGRYYLFNYKYTTLDRALDVVKTDKRGGRDGYVEKYEINEEINVFDYGILKKELTEKEYSDEIIYHRKHIDMRDGNFKLLTTNENVKEIYERLVKYFENKNN